MWFLCVFIMGLIESLWCRKMEMKTDSGYFVGLLARCFKDRSRDKGNWKRSARSLTVHMITTKILS